jgi:predicted transposase/invertase (TIGR01784 family)
LTRAQELFKRFTENEELNRYEARVKYERDLKYWKKCIQEQIRNEIQEECREEGIAIGEERGISIGLSQGITQGAHQKAVETAKKFLAMGLSVEQVADGTGLSIEEIEKL